MTAARMRASFIGSGAHQHEAGRPAERETHKADPRRINHRPVLPAVQQKIEQAHDVGRTRSPDRQRIAPRGVADRIAGMIDGGDNEAGIGQRLRRVVLLAEKSTPSVRVDDERQLCARDGTILRAFQAEIGGDR